MFGLIVNTRLSDRDTEDFKNTSFVHRMLRTAFLFSPWSWLSSLLSGYSCPPIPYFWPHISVNEISLFKVFASKPMINVKQPCRGASAQALMMLKCNLHCSWVSTREQRLQLPLTWTRTLNAKIWLSINQPTSDVPGSLSVLRLSVPGVAASFPIPLPQVPGDIVVVKGLPTAGWHQVKAWTLYSTVFKIASSLPPLVSLREDAEKESFLYVRSLPTVSSFISVWI